MSSKDRNIDPQARAALEEFKYEIANEVGIPLKHGYNGDLTAREAGRVGGNMVKKMVEQTGRYTLDVDPKH